MSSERKNQAGQRMLTDQPVRDNPHRNCQIQIRRQVGKCSKRVKQKRGEGCATKLPQVLKQVGLPLGENKYMPIRKPWVHSCAGRVRRCEYEDQAV